MPMQDKTDPATGRRAYRCYNDFEALKWREVRGMLPKIVDFGLATRLESGDLTGKEEIGIHPIQPDHYHAPEVVLGCGWGFKTDIWNFGVLVRYDTILRFLLAATSISTGGGSSPIPTYEMSTKMANSICVHRHGISLNARSYFVRYVILKVATMQKHI